jgi:predicted nucleic acid-binding protein
MSAIVVDASVAAKWFLPKHGENLTDEALELFRRYSRGDIFLMAPDLFWAELANIFWKAVRQQRWTKASAETALGALQQIKLTIVPTRTLLKSAFDIAISHDRTAYDSLYLALAVLLNVSFVTADERLVNALGATLPVKWLGSI